MFARAAALAIGEEQRIHLEELLRTGSTPQRTAGRCQVVLLASQGLSNNLIARQTGLSRPTVLATRAAFAKRGTAGICEPQKRKRSRRILTPELEQRILDTTLKTRPADATHWSARVLASKLGVSRMMVQRLWQRHDIPAAPRGEIQDLE
jgi:transposase